MVYGWRLVQFHSSVEAVYCLCDLGSGIILAGTAGATGVGDVYRSTDYGENWTKVRDLGIAVVYSLTYLGSGIVIAGTGNATGDGNIERSTDYGATWSTVEIDPSYAGVPAVYSLGSGVVLAGTGGAAAGLGEIWRSTDSGATWVKVYDPGLERFLCFINLGGSIVLAGSGDGDTNSDIYRSTDNGVNWSKVEINATNCNGVTCLCDLGSGVVLAGVSGSVAGAGKLYKSTDSGVTWNMQTLDASVDSIYSIVKSSDSSVGLLAGTGYAVGDGAVWFSTNSGTNWAKSVVSASLISVGTIVLTHPRRFLIGTGSGANLGDVWVGAPIPQLTTVDPDTYLSYGALVRIYGTELQGSLTTEITIDGVDYTDNITSISDTFLTFLAPEIADGTYNLIVISDGISSDPYSITYSTRSLLEMPIRAPLLYQHYDNDDGTPVALGKIYTYAAGTSTPLATLLSDGSTEAANPVILDAAGNANVYLKPGFAYKFVVKTALDVTISNGTQDNITGVNSGIGSIVTVETIAELEALSSLNNDYVTVLGYAAKTDNIAPRLYYLNSASTATPDGGSVIAAVGGGNYILVAGKEIDVKWFGALGDGTTNDYTAIYNANAYLVSIGGGSLIFSKGIYNYTTALTLSATVEFKPLPGAYLKSSNTSALTINNMSNEGLSKRIDTTVGTVTFGTKVDKVFVEWFGALGDGSTNDSTAIQKALDSHPKVEFLNKTYKVTTGISIPVACEIIGNDTIISPNANSIDVITFPIVTTADDSIKAHGFRITNGSSKTGITGLYASRCNYLSLKDIYIESVESGFYFSGGSYQSINDITAKSCTKAGLMVKGVVAQDYISNKFNSVCLDSNACGLFAFSDSGDIKNVSFNGLTLINNTVNGAYAKDSADIILNNLWISGNGSGASTVTVDSQTVYKADIYLTGSKVTLKDSTTDSTLNNSIQLANNSVLKESNYTGYAGGSNTQYLCSAGSKIYELGMIDAVGYKENIFSYGSINSISTPYICHGVGKSFQNVGKNFFTQSYPQTPNPTTSAPATEQLFKTDKFLNYEVDFAASIGSDGTNSASITFATGMSYTYQISTILIKCDTGSATLSFKWEDNTTSYTHDIIMSADVDDWTRMVFITAGKTSHELTIFPPDTAGVKIYLADAMVWDGSLEAISNIYQNCPVHLNQMGYYISVAAPTTGTWAKDDRIYKIDADTTEPIGFVCTTAGTPGTWSSYGVIY